jgi:hypothetical protein
MDIFHQPPRSRFFDSLIIRFLRSKSIVHGEVLDRSVKKRDTKAWTDTAT